MPMKFILALACLLLTGARAGTATAAGHPIEKVISMLKRLHMKATVAGEAEEKAYQDFTRWCDASFDSLKYAIGEENEQIAELEDLLSGKRKEKQSLEDDISDLVDQIAELEATGAKAKKLRSKEADLYQTTHGDVEKTIAAVGSALKAVSGAQQKTEPGMLFAQQKMQKVLALISIDSFVDEQQFNALQAFADPERPDLLAKGDKDSHIDKYDFKSENVIELLKQLEQKFKAERLALVKAETNAINAYKLAKVARDNAIKAAKDSKSKKESILGKVKDTIATAEGDLKNVKADKKTDSKTLADTEEECSTKKNEWEERSATREAEIEAMAQAVKILAKVTGVRTEAPSNPIPPPAPEEFLQLNSVSRNPKMAAVMLIREAAKATHSRAMERLAVEVSAHLKGPFDGLNNMIEKMVFRLMDEQKQEDEHKHWCDQELEKTGTMKDEKTTKIKDLQAEIESETAAIVQLTEEIKEADDMISKITKFMTDATAIREEGKKENAEAIKDAEVSQKALQNAISVLESFYQESGAIKKEPWEFLQEPVKLPKNPATWDSPYTQVADPKAQPSGILSVLGNVMADFAKMEAETQAQESVDQSEYEKAMSDNKIEKARRVQESEMKNDEKARRADKVAHLTGQKKDTSVELEKTLQYLKDLEPACITGDSTYEDRKKARATEIKALQKAKGILADAFAGAAPSSAAAFLQVQQHHQLA
jgi:hypothetical protein